MAWVQQPWQLQGGSWAWMPALRTAPEEGWLPPSPRSANLSGALGPRPCPAPPGLLQTGRSSGLLQTACWQPGPLCHLHTSHMGLPFEELVALGKMGLLTGN